MEDMMSFLGWIANGWAAAFFFVLMLAGLGFAVWMFFSDAKLVGALGLVVAVIFGVGWMFSATHEVVPVNSTALVIDGTTGQIVGDLRPAGLMDKPFFGSSLVSFPANSSYEWCPEFTPSTVGTYEVKVAICYYVDASKVDWKRLYLARRGDAGVIFAALSNQLAEKVAGVIKDYKPLELTTKREEVSGKLLTAGKLALGDDVPLVLASLKTWDFTNPDVAKAFDSSVIAQTKVDQAQADLAAAKVEREAQEYRAGTSGTVAGSLADSYRAACQKLGITSETGMLQCISTLWVAGLKNPPQNLVIGVGQNANPAIAVPAYAEPTLTPTIAPTLAK